MQATLIPQIPLGWLVNSRRCYQLMREFELYPDDHERELLARALSRLRGDNGGYGAPGANLPETATAVLLAHTVALPSDRTALTYAQHCERPPYGFNITPSATGSSVECQHAGLQVLHAFGTKPVHPGIVRRYIFSCQTTTGGFSRAPGALPTLRDSLCALECLSMLAGDYLPRRIPPSDASALPV